MGCGSTKRATNQNNLVDEQNPEISDNPSAKKGTAKKPIRRIDPKYFIT